MARYSEIVYDCGANTLLMELPALPQNGIFEYHTTVAPEWIDYNDHMNVAYYVRAFDLAIDSFKDTLGLSREYIEREQRSTVALEAHIIYRREASLGEELLVTTRILDFDGKKSHFYQEMHRADELLATNELLAISFDLASRKACPVDGPIARRYEQMVAAQSGIERPNWIGRSVGIRRK